MARWAQQHDRCRLCGTRTRSHKGRGLCYACYRRTRGHWPDWISECLCCHCSTVGMTKSIPRRMVHRDYRGFGLCWTCYREAERQGTLATWRAHYDQTINAGEGFSGRAALRLARLTGATEAAEILGVSLAIFRSWVPWDGNPDPEPVPMDLRWTLWMTLRAAEREEKET